MPYREEPSLGDDAAGLTTQAYCDYLRVMIHEITAMTARLQQTMARSHALLLERKPLPRCE